MTFEALIDAFAAEDEGLDTALSEAAANWDQYGPRFRALLHGFVVGEDQSERTERALFYVTHLLGGQADTGSFADLCALAMDPDRFDSVLGDDGTTLSYPRMLVSTFAGTAAPLHRLIEHEGAEELARGDALLVLAYVTRTGAIPEAATYDYLAGLPGRLQPKREHFVWFGFARAVAALGFSGLSGAVEQAISRGYIDAGLLTSADFWQDLRAAQQDPNDFSHPIWADIGPMGDPLAFLSATDDPDDGQDRDREVTEPVRNPMRHVGRNDPCPCGSGKKFKKCCLQAE